MEFIWGFKTELDLNNRQRTLCLQHAGCARFAYNWGLARTQAAMAARKAAADPQSVKSPTASDLHKALNALQHTEFPWMDASSMCAPQEALRDLDTAFSNLFAKRNKGIGSFTLTGAIHVGPDWIQLPTIGKVRLVEHGHLLQDTDLDATDCTTLQKREKKRRIVAEPAHYLSATVSKRRGHWCVSVQTKEALPDPTPATGAPNGVDLGIKTLAECSDGQEIANPKALRGNLTRLKRIQRRHSRRMNGSNNRKRSRHELARVYYRVGCIRTDALHQATATITARAKPDVQRPAAIILEDLKVSGIRKNHTLAQALADVGLGEFRRQMTYKSSWYGNRLYLASRFFPSRQLCSRCHRLPTVYLDLSIRTYHCAHCGLVVDRDLNAACNLMWLYTASSAEIDACGENVRPMVLALKAVSVKQEPNTE